MISAAFFLFVLQAEALTIDFLYQTPTDNSGKTSRFVAADNQNVSGSGFIIETFDKQGSSAATFQANGGTITVAAGGGFNTLDPTKLDVTGGGLEIRKGSVSGVAAKPANDETFFAFGPKQGAGTTNATVKVESSDFFAYNPSLIVWYLGLYYGSIDTYNDIAFYSGNSLLKTSTGFLTDGILSGSEILSAMGGISGNQLDDRSNVYVNLFFDANEVFTAFEFRTTGIAFELDNIVAGVRPPVPEPATIFLFGLGLLGVAGVSRRKKQ